MLRHILLHQISLYRLYSTLQIIFQYKKTLKNSLLHSPSLSFSLSFCFYCTTFLNLSSHLSSHLHIKVVLKPNDTIKSFNQTCTVTVLHYKSPRGQLTLLCCGIRRDNENMETEPIISYNYVPEHVLRICCILNMFYILKSPHCKWIHLGKKMYFTWLSDVFKCHLKQVQQ